MLRKDQELIYLRNGEEVSRLTAEIVGSLPLGFQQYFRFLQPYTAVGKTLSIPESNVEGEITTHFTTSPVTERIVEQDSLIFRTNNSEYKITYVHIDLERILSDGKAKGVNTVIDFPYL